MSDVYEQRLEARIARVGSHLCVGLDPRPERHPDGRVEAFLHEVVEQVAEHAAALKPNIAYFEAMGVEGYAMLDRLLSGLPSDLPVILDAKRSDIGETQRYYARAYFERWSVDAVTLNPFLGFDSLEPYLDYPGKGVYLLALTSNPGALELHLLESEGRRLYDRIFEFRERARGRATSVGFVVGLTQLDAEVLARLPDAPLLLPGLGAQGGRLEGLGSRRSGAPLLINASRSVLYPSDNNESYGARARRIKETINHALHP